ncbi:MAG: gfo/Idh/MocA family oxidoreductase [Alphaproteobacteria bacterium]|nr:gfo/Idh/MocA family oxidoreductase [Alphaproteobacteria bacterium]
MSDLTGQLAVVIGYGSIGQRHTRVLEELGLAVCVVSRRNIERPGSYSRIKDALAEAPDYVVVANETSRHGEALRALSSHGWAGVTLVEKPLVADVTELSDPFGMERLHVGYNMRFLPLLKALREAIGNARLLSVEARCGHWLPDWRPNRDYRQTYSARQEDGGGVLRDLSHELDYVQWIAGPWRRVFAQGGRLSSLETDVEDMVAMFIESESCPVVTVTLNYLDRTAERRLMVNTTAGTVRADFVAGTLSVDGQVRFEASPGDMDSSYVEMHRDVLSGNPVFACSSDAASDVVRLIGATELSMKTQEVVGRDRF